MFYKIAAVDQYKYFQQQCYKISLCAWSNKRRSPRLASVPRNEATATQELTWNILFYYRDSLAHLLQKYNLCTKIYRFMCTNFQTKALKDILEYHSVTVFSNASNKIINRHAMFYLRTLYDPLLMKQQSCCSNTVKFSTNCYIEAS